MLYAGVMSGTSLDGVDVALVRLEGREERPERAELIGFRTFPYDSSFREQLLGALETGGPAALCELNFSLGRRFAEAVATSLGDLGVAPAEVTAIGSHGQTVWHAPPDDDPGSTLQLGEAAIMAESLGVPVVADLRVRDVAAGGHGAPLTPYFDRLLLSSPTRARAIQNIGGMANVTWLPATDEGSAGRSPVAFDTGPGVVLIDEAVRALTDGDRLFDRDGAIAKEGTVVEEALAEWLADSFFQTTPPRSTGRERFGTVRLRDWLERHASERAEDLIATLTELTARTIVGAYRLAELDPDEVCVCGGGARNPELLNRLGRLLPDASLRPLAELGWDGDAREAAAFALLARQHHLGIAVDLTWATGAAGARILGKWVPA